MAVDDQAGFAAGGVEPADAVAAAEHQLAVVVEADAADVGQARQEAVGAAVRVQPVQPAREQIAEPQGIALHPRGFEETIAAGDLGPLHRVSPLLPLLFTGGAECQAMIGKASSGNLP